MSPAAAPRTYQFEAGIRLTFRQPPPPRGPSPDLVLTEARQLVVDTGGRVWVWASPGLLLGAYPAGEVIGWWSLARAPRGDPAVAVPPVHRYVRRPLAPPLLAVVRRRDPRRPS